MIPVPQTVFRVGAVLLASVAHSDYRNLAFADPKQANRQVAVASTVERLAALGGWVTIANTSPKGRVVFADCRAGAEELKLLRKTPNLTQLSLDNLSPAHSKAVGELAALETLYLCDSEVDVNLVQSLERLPNLSQLVLKRCSVSADLLVDMEKLARLKKLGIHHCNLADAQLESLSRFHFLKELRLSGDLTGECLQFVRFIKGLQTLAIRSDKLKLRHLRRLKRLPSLTKLILSKRNDWGDEDLGSLAALGQLTDLELPVDLPVTDLLLLAKLPRLRTLVAYGKEFKDEDAKRVDELFPKAQIVRSGPIAIPLGRFKQPEITAYIVQREHFIGRGRVWYDDNDHIQEQWILETRKVKSQETRKQIFETLRKRTTYQWANWGGPMPGSRQLAYRLREGTHVFDVEIGGSFTIQSVNEPSLISSVDMDPFQPKPVYWSKDGLRALGAIQIQIFGQRDNWFRGLPGESSPVKAARHATDQDIEMNFGESLHPAGVAETWRMDLSDSRITDESLRWVARLPNLEVLLLQNTSVTDAGLDHLRYLFRLRTLDLRGTKVTSAGLRALKRRLPRLRGAKLSDMTLGQRRDLDQIRSLSLKESLITDVGLEFIAQATNLNSLSLRRTKVTNAGLTHVGKLRRLGYLDVSESSITGSGLVKIAGLDRLTHLDARSIGGEKLIVRDLKKLEEFDFAGASVESLSLIRLPELHQIPVFHDMPIRRVHLQDTPKIGLIEIEGMQIPQFTTDALAPPRALWLSGKEITDDGVKGLLGLRRIDSLSFHNCKVTGEGLRYLAGLDDLAGLTLYNVPVHDADLAHLKNIRGLTSIVCHGVPVSDDGMVHLTEVKNLKSVQFENARITNKGLATLAKIRTLEWISVMSDTPMITNQGLEHLQRLPVLKFLSILPSTITDSGLENLTDLKNLRHLHLHRSQITEEGVNRLKKANPILKIQR